MINFIDGLIDFIQVQPGFTAFIGTYVSEDDEYGTIQYGPFLMDQGDTSTGAPEGTDYPFVTMQVFTPSSDMTQGFGNLYVEDPIVRFHFWDIDPDAVGPNCEFFQNTFDLSPNIPLSGGELCRSMVRLSPARPLTPGYNEQVQRVYHWITEYQFRVKRTKGI